MTQVLYPKFKTSLGVVDTNSGLGAAFTGTNAVFCSLVDTAVYTYNVADQFYDTGGANDVTDAKVGTDQEITSPTFGTVSQATFDGADLTYTAVTGASVEALVLYRKNSGAATTYRLVYYADTGVTGLPVTPNGGNITVTWNASGIFTLSDERAKTDINVVGKLGPFDVCEYRYRGDNTRQLGFIAQDVERYCPDAVMEIGGLKRVNYAQAMEWENGPA